MLEQLRKKLEELLVKMNAMSRSVVNDKGEVRSFTEDEKSNYEKLEQEVGQTRDAIDRAVKEQESMSVVRSLGASNTSREPNISVTREEGFTEEGECRLFKPVGKGGLGEFMQCVKRHAANHGLDSRLDKLQRAALGANEGVGAEGGFLLQSDHAEKLFTSVVDAGQIAPLCTLVPMSKSSTTISLLDETSLAIGSQFGGVRAYWRAEAGAVTATKPKFREENIKAEALEALFYATDEQLEDAPQLEAFANIAFATCMAFQLDDAIVRGNGAGKPLGVLNAPCLISVAKESAQTQDTVNYANIDNMTDRLLVGSEDRAKWFIHPDVRKQLRNALVTPGSKTDFMPFMPAGGIASSPNDTLYGRPIVRTQHGSALGDLGDVLLADFFWYLLFIRKGVTASQSIHVAFLTGEQVFKWTMRANGQPVHSSAITDAHGSTTRSAFVSLAERA
jgi:HK97 family phage major capsid protein